MSRAVFFLGVLLVAACGSDAEADAPAPLPSNEPAKGAVAESCANGVRDGAETDVDCGGSVCPGCALANACTVGTDCVSMVCTAGKCTNDTGCSDGTREGFASVADFPSIAACAGGWSVAGLLTTTTPACGRASGNDSANKQGMGCNVADLCQPGWRVCATAAEVAAKTAGAGCAGATIAGANAFFVVRQSGPGGAQCGSGSNDLFGCGDVGLAPDATSCAPLNRFSNDLCAALPATWACGANGAEETNSVTKTASEGGGVLCCRD